MNRLSRILVMNGFGDLKIKVRDQIVESVRSILMNGNETIKKLILDEKMEGVLELYEKCEVDSFLEIEKYYSGGTMELNDDNICDILRFSIYYNDKRIMKICNKYLKKQVNDSIMIEIFDILFSVNVNDDLLNEFKSFSEENIKLNGFKYLNDDELLLKLNIQSIKFILNNRKLIIKDENWLLNRLLKWYEDVLKKSKSDESENDLNEFISIIKTKIHLNEIRQEEIGEENMNVLRELDIKITNEKSDYICIKNIDEISNKRLIEIIHELYLKEESDYDYDDEKMVLTDNQIKTLNNEKVKEDLAKLLHNEDIKIVEIVLNLIIEMKISNIIPNNIKSELLARICLEYNKSKRNLTLKCLSLFIDDKKNITIMEGLCGKEVLYKLLNEECYNNSQSKELLVEYIHEIKLSEEDEEEMSKIILDGELLEELKYKKITHFHYPQSEYLFGLNEEFSIIPLYGGNKCEFSINPGLPSGIKIDKTSGIIHGKVKSLMDSVEYEVKCRNKKNEKKFVISLDFQIKFRELNKSSGLIISNNGKIITNTNNNNHHCYLSLKLEEGVYYIEYKFNSGEFDDLVLGLSTDNSYSGNDIYKQPTTCNYCAYYKESRDITDYCHIGTVVNENPKFSHGDGSIYKLTIDMNKREFSIAHNDSSPVLLVKDLPSPLYTYCGLGGSNCSVEFLLFYRLE